MYTSHVRVSKIYSYNHTRCLPLTISDIESMMILSSLLPISPSLLLLLFNSFNNGDILLKFVIPPTFSFIILPFSSLFLFGVVKYTQKLIRYKQLGLSLVQIHKNTKMHCKMSQMLKNKKKKKQ